MYLQGKNNCLEEAIGRCQAAPAAAAEEETYHDDSTCVGITRNENRQMKSATWNCSINTAWRNKLGPDFLSSPNPDKTKTTWVACKFTSFIKSHGWQGLLWSWYLRSLGALRLLTRREANVARRSRFIQSTSYDLNQKGHTYEAEMNALVW